MRLRARPELEFPLIEICEPDASPPVRLTHLPGAPDEADWPVRWCYGDETPLSITWWSGHGGHGFALDIPEFCADGDSVRGMVMEIMLVLQGLPVVGTPLQYLQYAAWQQSESNQHMTSGSRHDPVGIVIRGRIDALACTREEVLAAWMLVLWAGNFTEEVMVSLAGGGRFSEEFEGAVGAFAVTCPVSLGPAREFPASVLGEAARAWSEVDRRTLPFDWSGVDARQVCAFRWHDFRDRLVAGNLECQLRATVGTSDTLHHGRLALEVVATRNGLICVLQGDARWLDGGEAEDWLDRYETVLEGLGRGLGAGAVELVGKRERERLLGQGGGAQVEQHEARDVLELIEQVAQRWPDRVAVRACGHALSYGGLVGRARRIAQGLREVGVRDNDRVGVLIERGTAQIEAVLGVLAAGAAYVALDVHAPGLRLSQQLADCGARFVLVQAPGRVEEGLAGVHELSVHALLQVRQGWYRKRSGGAQLAYVLYTSGSTGSPKGVAITQQGLLSSTLARRQAYARSPEVLLLLPGVFFDSSVAGLFWTLSSGGTLVLPAEAQVRDARQLGLLVRQQAVTHWLSVPSLYAAVLEAQPHALEGLRLVIVAGEACASSLVQQHHAQLGQASLYNEYGPTEATVWCTFAVLQPDQEVTIGHPVAGTRVDLMDPCARLAPQGARAQLWVGGAGLAQGYWGRPAETAARFLPHPLGDSGQRAYCSGDWGWRGRDGAIRFLGREDAQVKLNGYRVELSEVEAALGSHQAVQSAVVVVVRSQVLHGYTVCRAGMSVTGEQLREHLARHLPAYMVPATLTTLPALPLLPNGKVDRQALGRLRPQQEEQGRSAAGATEVALMHLWQDLLGLTQVGAQQDFFALGGHSLLAMRLIARVQRTFGVSLSFEDILNTPTIEAISSRIDELQQGDMSPSVERIDFRDPNHAIVASDAQRRFYILHQLDEHSPRFNCCAAFVITGPVNEVSLRAAFTAIVRRHDILRTTYVMSDGIVLPHLHEDFVIQLCVMPAESQTKEQFDAAVREHLKKEAARPFDLAVPPLLRLTLVRRSQTESALVICLHHIASDDWSIDILLNDFSRLYDGEDGMATPRSLQYADYSAWQNRQSSGGQSQDELAAWIEHLRGVEPTLALPTDGAPPKGQELAAASQRFEVPAILHATIAAYSRERGCTPFMVHLAVFGLLMSRFSARRDFIVGTVLSLRAHPQLQDMVGYLSNTVALRIRIDDGIDFSSWLDKVAIELRFAQIHRAVPFDRVVDALAPERHEHANPLAQVYFVQQAPLPPARSVGDIVLQGLPLDTGIARADLMFSVELSDEGGALVISHSASLFEQASITALGGQYIDLLAATVGQPLRPLGSFHMAKQLLQASLPTPVAGDLFDLFAEQINARPDAVAMIEGHEQLTYRGLHRKAIEICRRLRDHGVAPGSHVVILGDGGIEFVAAMLGVIACGAAYVPVDPQWPAERIRRICDLVEPSAILANAGVIVQNHEHRQLRLEADGENLLPRRAGRNIRRHRAPPNATAYVIFTSGTTGEPKGVQITHGNVRTFLHGMVHHVAPEPTDSWTQFHSVCFDVSVWEIWGSLTTGGRLVFVPKQDRTDADEVWRLMRTQGITLLSTTPSAFQVLLSAGSANHYTHNALRIIGFGGEPLPYALVRRWRSLSDSRAALLNLYGPTETTVYAMARDVSLDPTWGSRSPIGVPMHGYTARVVDRAGQPVPTGWQGELWIGGGAISCGYLRRPALTADRFVPDPLGASGSRAYRSGDSTRPAKDGGTLFVGRTDQQVKLRGFRIELGEIDASLKNHPSVRDSVTTFMVGDAGARLVTYALAQDGTRLDEQVLRDWLRRELPDYMVPARIVEIDTFPLTRNGKVDKSALSLPAERSDSASASLAPAEKAMQVIWEEVLARKVAPGDNFFDAGGDSLLALTIVSRMRESGLHVSVKDIFRHQTIRALAKAAAALSSPGDLQPYSTALTLSPAQRWFLQLPLVHRSRWNQAVLLRLNRPVPRWHVELAIDQLARRHRSIQRTFVETASGWMAVDAPIDKVVAHINIETAEEERCAQAVHAAFEVAHQRINLSGPLMCVLHQPTTADASRLMGLVVHHLVFDTVSWQVWLRELGQMLDSVDPVAVARGLSAPGCPDAWAHATESAALSANLTLRDEAMVWKGRVLSEALFSTDSTLASSSEAIEWISSEALAVNRRDLMPLSALALSRALRVHARVDEVPIEVESHGRMGVAGVVAEESIIGWLTAFVPILVKPGLADPAALEDILSQWDAHRDLAAADLLSSLNANPPRALLPVVLNVVGEVPAGDPSGVLASVSTIALPAGRAAEDRPPFLLELSVQLEDGRLKLHAICDRRIGSPGTMRGIVAAIGVELERLVSSVRLRRFHRATLPDDQLQQLLQGRTASDLYPLLPLQEGMLYHAVRDRDRGVYLVQLVVTLAGWIDAGLLHAAWQRVTDRHDALRTSIHWHGLDQPHQMVCTSVAAKFGEINSSDSSVGEFEAFLRSDREAGIDLQRQEGGRLTLWRDADDSSRLIWTYSHVLVDGWSAALVLGEVAHCYAALRCGRSPALAPPRQIADHLMGDPWEVSRDQEFWGVALDGLPAINLVQAKQPAAREFNRVRLHLSRHRTDALVAKARSSRVTIATVVHLLWAVALSRGEPSTVIFGSTVSGRPPQANEIRVGPYIATIPVPVRWDRRDQSIDTWLNEIQDFIIGAQDHIAIPLSEMQKAAGMDGRFAMFDSVVVWENYPVPKVEPDSGFNVQAVRFIEELHYPLNLYASMQDDAVEGSQLVFELAYDQGRVGQALVDGLMRSVERASELLETLGDSAADLLRKSHMPPAPSTGMPRPRPARRAAASRSPAEQNVDPLGLVHVAPCVQTGSMPLVVTPRVNGLWLGDWLASSANWVRGQLAEHGAILLRGFSGVSSNELPAIAKVLSGGLYEYTFRASPRTEVSPKVYTSTDYPRELSIFPHNEHAFAPVVPGTLYFLCEQPATMGGATPIGNCRQLLRSIDPEVVEAFRRRGVLYVRNYASSIGLSWQTVFQTESRREVDAFCEVNGLGHRWDDEGGLQTRFMAPAIVKHLTAGEIWFNHATFHNLASLDPDVVHGLLTGARGNQLPNNTYYGDGEPIDSKTVAHLREAYLKTLVRFDWQRSDLLVLDNLLCCHGRDPFEGQRRVVVGMSNPLRPHAKP